MARDTDPHASQPILHTGSPIDQARLIMILLHGRGASAQDILGFSSDLQLDGIAYLAPQAADSSWYPARFLVETRLNEPYLSSALRKINSLVEVLGQEGIPSDRIGLLGFSQGACLALEYAARNAQRYAAVIGLSGGLIGADSETRIDRGHLAGTPVFLGCSDNDPHIPASRVKHAADILQNLGGLVTTRLYSGIGHTIIADEIEHIQAILT